MRVAQVLQQVTEDARLTQRRKPSLLIPVVGSDDLLLETETYLHVCSQVTWYVVGAWVIVRPCEQLAPNTPSFIFWSFNIGFVWRRSTRGSVSSRGRGAVGFRSTGMTFLLAQQAVWPSSELERVAGRAGQLDPDGLHLGVFVERVDAVFAT